LEKIVAIIVVIIKLPPASVPGSLLAMAAAPSDSELRSSRAMSAGAGGEGDHPRRILEPGRPVYFDLLGGAIRATLRLTESGKLEVSSETSEPSHAGRRIKFAFRDPVHGRVIPSVEVTLEPVEGGPPPWEGVRECEVPFDVPFTVQIDIEPGDD
jgi:hypothetical protein